MAALPASVAGVTRPTICPSVAGATASGAASVITCVTHNNGASVIYCHLLFTVITYVITLSLARAVNLLSYYW